MVLLGDPHQLPPVIKSRALAAHCGLAQSMFTRLLRLGVPAITLDMQGRCRPELAALFAWRYAASAGGAGAGAGAGTGAEGEGEGAAGAALPSTVSVPPSGASTGTSTNSGAGPGAGPGAGVGLGNLPHVLQSPLFNAPNPGFRHTCQLVPVGPFFPAGSGPGPGSGPGSGSGSGNNSNSGSGSGAGSDGGESTPSPFFYQNLGEAEYVVACYQYMRLLRYPASSIAILTTYNGQKQLLLEVLRRRCDNALFGMPAHVTTVDQFQGSQSDYVLLSLVRTKAVGHLRDERRLVVALSRARLGLYVFCRPEVFLPVAGGVGRMLGALHKGPGLELVVGESYPPPATAAGSAGSAGSAGAAGGEASRAGLVVQSPTELGVLVYQLTQQAQSLQAK